MRSQSGSRCGGTGYAPPVELEATDVAETLVAVQSKIEEAMIDVKLEDFARRQVREVLGPKNTVRRVEIMRAGPEHSVLRVTLAQPPGRLVLKVAGADTEQVNFHRTATALSLARSAGVPVPTVLAVDTSYRSGPWSYLLPEHVDGVDWRRLRPLLAPRAGPDCASGDGDGSAGDAVAQLYLLWRVQRRRPADGKRPPLLPTPTS